VSDLLDIMSHEGASLEEFANRQIPNRYYEEPQQQVQAKVA